MGHRATNYQLLITHYQLPITHYPLPINEWGMFYVGDRAQDVAKNKQND